MITTLSRFYFSNRKLNFILIMCSFYAFVLLLLRAKITHSIFLFFLIWNLFLACIPYVISTYLYFNSPTTNLKKGILYSIWLLFIPNSFYILTDFVHLKHTESTIFYYDLLIIAVYASLGFTFGIISFQQMLTSANTYINHKLMNLGLPFICFLIGFGVYIGRELRYNSWDILHKPITLIVDLAIELTQFQTIGFAFSYGSLVYITLKIIQHLNKNNKSKIKL